MSMVRFQENMKKMRENPETSRAGLKWDDAEDEKVLEKLMKNVSIDDIAKELKRTPNSIQTRKVMYAIKQIEQEKKDRKTVMTELNVSEEDMKEHKEKKQQREEQQKSYSNYILNKNTPNPTIKDTFTIIRELVVSIQEYFKESLAISKENNEMLKKLTASK